MEVLYSKEKRIISQRRLSQLNNKEVSNFTKKKRKSKKGMKKTLKKSFSIPVLPNNLPNVI